MASRSSLRRWIEAACLAMGAGLAALMVQDEHAGWKRQVIAFFAAVLPVVAAHLRSSPATAKAAP